MVMSLGLRLYQQVMLVIIEIAGARAILILRAKLAVICGRWVNWGDGMLGLARCEGDGV